MGRQFYAIPSREKLDEIGTYFVACNPTPGTGLATIAAPTAYDETKAFLLLRNREQLGSGMSIYPDYVKLINSAPGTAGASVQFTAVLDSDLPNTKWTSGGSELVSNSPYGPVGNNGSGQVRAGALVTIAGPKPRIISNTTFRTAIPVIGDTYVLNFGQTPAAPGLVSAASKVLIVEQAPAVEIPGQWVLGGYLWLPSQSAASSWQVEVGYWEAPSGLIAERTF